MRKGIETTTAEAPGTVLCGLCDAAIVEHFNDEGRYTGCPKEAVNNGTVNVRVLTRGLSRDTDDADATSVLRFVPTLVSGIKTEDAETTETPERGRRARRGAAKRAGRKERAARKSVAKESRTSGAGRGRAAGLYVAGKKEPTKLTESIEKVYKTIKSARKGIGLRDISEKLGMKTGTVGWALQKLAKQHAVSYQAAEAA